MSDLEFSLKLLNTLRQMAVGPVHPTTLPRSGICNEVIGIFSEILSWKTVSERRTVTPRTQETNTLYSATASP